MASFLQNNGDILLDAVLTDYGRRLLAKGDGSFNIVKFAFGDDEIDYGLYNPNTESMSQDLEIMRTPILEAFTNNAASMKSQLLTLGITNTLFLPVLKLNTSIQPYYTDTDFDCFVVPVDTDTNKTTDSLTLVNVLKEGVLTPQKYMVVDQGLDSNKLKQSENLKTSNPPLYENSYNVYIDTRFGYISDNNGKTLMPLSIDDDGIGVYKFTEQSSVTNPTNIAQVSTIEYKSNNINSLVIAGTQGSRLKIGVIPNNNLFVDTYFDKYGTSGFALNTDQPSKDFRTLRSSVRVVGVTTGYSLDIPILYAKVQTE